MSQENNRMSYGYVADNSKDLQSKQGGRFGGNFGVAFIKAFSYQENVAKEGNPVREAIEVELLVRDRTQKIWFSPVNKVFGENSTELNPGDDGYDAGFNAAMVQQNAVIVHYLKALGVSDEALQNNLKGPFNGFKGFSDAITGLLPTGYESKPLDLFMEFQWNIGKKSDGTPNDKTYPTVPKNMKGGYFLVGAQPGEWSEVRGEDGSLGYVNAEGTPHPFKRDETFMSGNKGVQQFLNGGGAGAEESSDFSPNPMAQGNPQSKGW
jgi:hypothetical protein